MVSLNSTQRQFKILQEYLYELLHMIEHDAYNCKLITTGDELRYHANIVKEFIDNIDKLLS